MHTLLRSPLTHFAKPMISLIASRIGAAAPLPGLNNLRLGPGFLGAAPQALGGAALRPFATLGAPDGAGSAQNRPAFNRMLTKQELKNFQGSYLRYKRNAGLPEFHNVDRDRNGLVVAPTDRFMLVVTTSKNNVHVQLVNRSRNYRTVFGSFAGNVGYRKKMQQSEKCAYRIGENVARKCRRLGVFAVDVKFRRIARVESLLQAFQALGLRVGQLIHEPRLPKTGINSVRPRRRRRV